MRTHTKETTWIQDWASPNHQEHPVQDASSKQQTKQIYTRSSADRITTPLSFAHQRKNKQKLGTNLTLYKAYRNHWANLQFSSVQLLSCVQLHESQHSRPPCPSPTPRVYSNSCPWSRWCHPAISSSVVPFSSCPQPLPGGQKPKGRKNLTLKPGKRRPQIP